MDLSRERLTRLYEQVTSSIDELIGALAPGDYDRRTDCPEWTVKDILGHLSSFEAISVGLAEHAAHVDVSARPYAVGFNEAIERDVELRRGSTPAEIADEFRDATLKRGEALRGLSDADYETDATPTPFGAMPTASLMPIRIIDLYFHEQDIRRATGNPGHLDGEAARFCFERMRAALPKILGKGAGVSDDQTVVFNLTAHAGETLAFATGDDGKIAETADVPADPTVRIATDLERFLMLTGGRGNPGDHLADGSVTLRGDQTLGRAILKAMAVTP